MREKGFICYLTQLVFIVDMYPESYANNRGGSSWHMRMQTNLRPIFDQRIIKRNQGF